MTPEEERIAKFVKERDELLIAGDLNLLAVFQLRNNPGTSLPSSRLVAEIALHKARTGAKTLPIGIRTASKRWLIERGYQPLDDGDVPI